jgi:hypothetical protein
VVEAEQLDLAINRPEKSKSSDAYQFEEIECRDS